MEINLKKRNFLKLIDFSTEEIQYLITLASKLKKSKFVGLEEQMLYGKNIALIFEKASTRTRCAFETAAFDPVSYTHLRAHETRHDIVCRLLLEKKKKKI